MRDVMTLYVWTAARGGEIVQMQAGQITQEADGWWWTMPKALTKGAKREAAMDLRVPLVGRALEVVQRRMRINPKVHWPKSDAMFGLKKFRLDRWHKLPVKSHGHPKKFASVRQIRSF